MLDYNYNIKFEKNAFKGIKQLHFLSVTHVNLQVLSYVVFRHVIFMLHTLHLHDNSLKKINEKFEPAFANISKLKVLTLLNNPLDCSSWVMHVLSFRHVNLKTDQTAKCKLSINPRIIRVDILHFYKIVIISCTAYADVWSKFSWYGTDMRQINQSNLSLFIDKNNSLLTSSLKIPYELYDRQFSCKVRSNDKTVSAKIFVKKAAQHDYPSLVGILTMVLFCCIQFIIGIIVFAVIAKCRAKPPQQLPTLLPPPADLSTDFPHTPNVAYDYLFPDVFYDNVVV